MEPKAVTAWPLTDEARQFSLETPPLNAAALLCHWRAKPRQAITLRLGARGKSIRIGSLLVKSEGLEG